MTLRYQQQPIHFVTRQWMMLMLILLLLLWCHFIPGCHGGFFYNSYLYHHHHHHHIHMKQSRPHLYSQLRMVALTPKMDVPSSSSSSESTTTTTTAVTAATTTPTTSSSATTTTRSFVLTKEECHPIIRIGTNNNKKKKEKKNEKVQEGDDDNDDNEKIINLYGIYCIIVSLITFPIWIIAMSMVHVLIPEQYNIDPHRSIYDTTGKIWSKIWLFLCHSYPTVSGNTIQFSPITIQHSSSLSQQQQQQQPCLYVANHASWLDIPILCTVLDPVFKFIAKGELGRIPGIGQQLHGGHHILIDREDRKSQLRTFKESMAWLQKGVPIMAFPEGMRSRDGRLMEFKKGIFSLAVKANVPIVPITLCHTHAIMPTYSFVPVQSGHGKVHVHIGTPIDPTGKTESELELLVRDEFLSHLPNDQLPLLLLQQQQITNESH